MTVNEKTMKKYAKTYYEWIKAKHSQFSKGKEEGLLNDLLLMEEIMKEVFEFSWETVQEIREQALDEFYKA